MLLARAFVLSVNQRALLAIAAIAFSVAYALVSAAAASGLREAGETLAEESLSPGVQVLSPDGAPFAEALAAGATTLVREAAGEPVREGTIEPWPHGAQAVATPYVARGAAEAVANGTGLPLLLVPGLAHASPGVVYLPPDVYAGRHPGGAVSRAYLAAAPEDAKGLLVLPAAGAEAFYVGGAGQVAAGLYLLVLAAGLVVTVLSAGVMRLEVLARSRDLATLEAIGGRRQARAVIVGRVLFLVGAGAALGLAGTLLVVDLLGSSADADFSLSAGWIAFVLAVTGVAGVAAGSFAGLRSLRDPLASRLGRRGPESRRFPGPIRFLAVSPRAAWGVLGAAIVTAGIFSVVLGAASTPVRLFAPEDGTTFYGAVAGNPFRGTASRFLAEMAPRLADVEAASPEIYGPTVAEGRPLLVRGVDLSVWPSLVGARLEEGRWPAALGEAALGARAAKAMGIGPGDALSLPTSYGPGLVRVLVVGLHSGTGFSDDEALTDLDTAGAVAGLPADQAHALRLRERSEDALPRLAGLSTVEVLSLRVDGTPVPWTNVTVTIEAVNLGGAALDHRFAVRVNGATALEVPARLPAHAVTRVSAPVTVPPAPDFTVEVNPAARSPTISPDLLLDLPSRAEPNGTVAVAVRDGEGRPVANVSLGAATGSATTDAAGRAALPTGPPGLFVVEAHEGARRGGGAVRVAPSAWDDRSVLVVEALFLSPSSPSEREGSGLRAEALLVNLGGANFTGPLNWTFDGKPLPGTNQTLRSGDRTTLAAFIEAPLGTHRVGLLGRTGNVTVAAAPGAPPPGSGPSTVEEVMASRERAGAATATPEERTQALLRDTFEDLETATAVVLLATALHTGAAVWVSVLREAREREGVIRVLTQLGATRAARMGRGLRDALLAMLLPVAVGPLVALIVLSVASGWGFPAAFGHTVPIALTLGLSLRVATLLLVVSAGAALYAVATSRRPPPQAVPRRPLAEVVFGGPG